jgi:SRR1
VNQLKSCVAKIAGGPIDRLICLGLGHFSDCTISRYQLALALLVQESFQIRLAQFYDPIFTKNEQDFLIDLKCEVLSENREGKYSAGSEGCTIFYLPHCPKQISNNILWRNWSKESLERTILIGNSFSNILTATPLRLLEKTGGYIVRIEKFCTEIPLRNNFRFTDIFNDTSIHIFESSKLAAITESDWLNADEPKYTDEDSELITSPLNSLSIE